MLKIDLNADIGESYGSFQVGNDEQLMSVITSANVACGFHAGDYNTIASTIKLAKKNGVDVGAHPGFQDLFGFGRRPIPLTSEEIYHMVVYQIGAIQAYCHVEKVPLVHVKPHGALYNIASKDNEVAHSIAKAVYDVDQSLVLFGICNGSLLEEGKKVGLTTAAEAFADRTYSENGLLTPRNETDALHLDLESMKKQVLEIVKEGKVTAASGNKVEIKADTICFHGDGVSAYEHASKIKQALIEEGVHIKNVGEQSGQSII